MGKSGRKWITKPQISDVKCPRCWAGVGKRCSDEKGPRERCHAERLKYALEVHGLRPRAR